MSRPPSVAQFLKRAGLSKRPRPKTEKRRHQQQKIHSVPHSQPEHSTKPSTIDGSSTTTSEGNPPKNTPAHHLKKEAQGDVVDDQIAALERELEQNNSDDGSSSSTDDDTDSSGEDREGAISGDAICGRINKQGYKLVSPLDSEKIEPLPRHLLPQPGCGVSKKQAKKRSRVVRPDEGGRGVGGGLASAVGELLANYEARSSERVPFYCRVCKFQGKNLEELEEHKLELLHQEAAKKERKISRCTLCKKQFTSPPQLQEHLAGKAHVELLQATMTRQGKRVPGAQTGTRSTNRDGAGGTSYPPQYALGGARGTGRGGRGGAGGFRGRGGWRGGRGRGGQAIRGRGGAGRGWS